MPAHKPRFDPRVIALFLIALRLGAAIWAIDLSEGSPRGAENDIVHYHELAEAEGLPYRDFVVEWPPVGYAVIEAVSGREPAAMTPRLVWLMFAVDVGTFAAIAAGWTNRAGLAYLILGTPLLPIIYLRLDLVAVSLTVLAALLVKRNRERGAGIALAGAVLTKVWPLVLIPVLAARSRWTAVGWGAASLAVATRDMGRRDQPPTLSGRWQRSEVPEGGR